jgi:hypothetical protein
MTFQPPPPPQGPPPQGPPPQGPPPPPQGPPPGGPPGGYGGPPGQWGPPPGGGGGPSNFGSFDPKSVNNLDWGILGAGVLTFIFSFFTWYSYDAKGCGAVGVCVTLTESAWGGFLTLLAILLVLVGTAMVALELFMPHVKLPVPNRLIGLGCYVLAALLVILGIFVIPGASVGGVDVPDSEVDSSHGFGFWVGLILILAGAVLSFMRFQQTGGKLPIGGQRPGGHPGAPGQQPPPGYGPPPQ